MGGCGVAPVQTRRVPSIGSIPLRDKNGCLVAFSTLLLHVRQSHTHLPPSLRKEERGSRQMAAGGEKFIGLRKSKPSKGILSTSSLKTRTSALGKSGGKRASLEA